MFDQKPSDTMHREKGGRNCKDGYITFSLLCYMGGRRLNGHGTLGFHRLFQGQQGFIISFFARHQTLYCLFFTLPLVFVVFSCMALRTKKGGRSVNGGERTMLKKQKHTHERKKPLACCV